MEPRDGVKGLLEFGAIRWKETLPGSKKDSVLLLPGQRTWPEVAVNENLRMLAVDLGQRHGAAVALWGINAEATEDSPGWQIGQTRNGEEVLHKLLDKGVISLPGDDEALPRRKSNCVIGSAGCGPA